jgi:Flp pilus assembly protein TadG
LCCSVPWRFGKKWNYRFRGGFYVGITKLEEDALKKILIVGALAFAATAIAETANAAEFYVVRDAATKKCTIVDTKPTTTTTTVVDNGTFKTRTEAETGMKTMKVCTTN